MISQGTKLSQRLAAEGGGKIMNNNCAKTHDIKVRDVMKQLYNDLQLKYPQKEWKLMTNIPQTMISKNINEKYVPSNKKSSIRPDGGVLFMDNIPVLSTEAKKQGTNDKRKKDGKSKQQMGNAIERAHKNYNEIKNLQEQYLFTSYILFGYGCDFVEGSSIVDRLSAMTYYDTFNTLHIKDQIIEKKINGKHLIERRKKASVFLQEDPFDEKFIYEKCMSAIHIVLTLI
ncbi:MAG: hypothetical protein CL779_00180 [Chloroflexi bacterium]|nr:hypothetical protein [Chloroflexota bacterium]